METAIVLLIVGAALYYAVVHFKRIFSTGKDDGNSCGCSCSGCDNAASECTDQRSDFTMDTK